MNTAPVAVLNSVSVDYPTSSGPVHALRDVTVEFNKEESAAVVGRSGSGKSTMLSVLALMRTPTSGQVFLGDICASETSQRGRAALRSQHVGIIFQSFHLEPSLTAVENVMLPNAFSNESRPFRDARKRAFMLLDALDIEELAGRKPAAVSGGQRQRIAIARAMFQLPELLVADEPTGNLDEETADLVTASLLNLTRAFGTSVVIVTHDALVAQRADHVFHLVGGTLSGTSVSQVL